MPTLADSAKQLQTLAAGAEDPDLQQLLAFLADELTAEKPRKAIVNSVLTSLGQSTDDTELQIFGTSMASNQMKIPSLEFHPRKGFL
ncbi:hypothetical protein CW734_06170 [Planococcus sp. MB-3u-03]|nr:hypothetical protein CW734_06170 [Planococcus sp. MB-3u-03]